MIDLVGNHIMVDLEAMDNSSSAAIVSIGAVKFNATGITDQLYLTVDLGLTIGAGTVYWWLAQGDEAKKALLDKNCCSIGDALRHFARWAGDNPIVWGNGADFDNVILVNAYRAAGMDQPWEFYNNRCYRTVKNLFPDVKIKRSGTHHNALDDARSQAEHLIDIVRGSV